MIFKMITSWPSVLQVLGRAPFEPKPSEKPLSEVSNFSLHSDRRAEERTKFEIKLKQKEAEIEGAKRKPIQPALIKIVAKRRLDGNIKKGLICSIVVVLPASNNP